MGFCAVSDPFDSEPQWFLDKVKSLTSQTVDLPTLFPPTNSMLSTKVTEPALIPRKFSISNYRTFMHSPPLRVRGYR